MSYHLPPRPLVPPPPPLSGDVGTASVGIGLVALGVIGGGALLLYLLFAGGDNQTKVTSAAMRSLALDNRIYDLERRAAAASGAELDDLKKKIRSAKAERAAFDAEVRKYS